MLIKQITLQNFRQFKGKQGLVFATDPNQNVTVLLGENTFGKTTILQAFNWCLFNEADFPKESNPDLLNMDLAEEKAGMEQKLEVYVELLLEHGVPHSPKTPICGSRIWKLGSVTDTAYGGI